MLQKMYKWLFVVALLAVLAGCAAQVHHSAGVAAMARQDYSTGVAELAKAAELAPGDVAYRRDWLRAQENANNRLLANAANAIAIRDYKLAETAYREVLKYEPDNSRALAGLRELAQTKLANDDVTAAHKAFTDGDLVKALDLTGSALKRIPGFDPAVTLKSQLETAQAASAVGSPRLGTLYRKTINLEFRDASIKLVFDALSRSTGINFIFDRDVKPDQRTTVFLKQTPLDDAIDVILATSQLEKKVLNASSVLVYPNTPAKLREYQDLLVRAFYLSNVEAKQTASLLKTVLKLKDVFVDDKYNMLVLRESPETIGLAEKLIRLHDLDEPEVMLEIEVLEINRTRLLNAGVQWPGQLTVTPLGTTTSTPINGNSTSTMKVSDFSDLNGSKIAVTAPVAAINLQKTDGEANLLANPRIRVRDRERAKILIGDKVPVVTTTSTNTFVTENIQYLDVGLKLEVEPDIHLRDEIGLKLGLEVSSLVSSVKTNNGSQAYQIGTRNFSSALRLKDGETQVLAGLISDEERSAGNRIPVLGEFPLLGRLFGSQNDSRQKTEIVLSITPHLIRNIERQGPAAESFWSGTEVTLRDRPLQLRAFDQKQILASPNPSVEQTAAAPTLPNAPRLSWTGPAAAKPNEVVSVALTLDSEEPLRAGAAQVGYNPAEFEFVAVEDGGYFGKEGKAAFSKSIDAANGQVSLGFDVGVGPPAIGHGQLFVLRLKARKPGGDAKVGLISFTPIGAKAAVGRPALPFTHSIDVSP